MQILECNKWDARFFAMSDLIASWSEDRNRKVGCVIVGDANEVRSIGYNGFPRNVNADPVERHSSKNDEKYLWFEHAERNAIYNMVRVGVSATNCKMYCNSFPCADCARAIIQSGISELRTYAPDLSDKNLEDTSKFHWKCLKKAG